MSKIVYHYCAADSFLSIIGNSTLRASNIRKSNDYGEIVFSIDLYKESMQRAIQRYVKKNPNDTAFKEFAKVNIDAVIEEKIDNDSCTFYVMCFSKQKDKLSQWRGYAADGTGIAIGFNYELLQQIGSSYNFVFAPVKYVNKRLTDDLANEIFEQISSVGNRHGTETDYQNMMFCLCDKFLREAVFYKNAAFAEEEEYRLVFYPFGEAGNLKIRGKSKDMTSYQMYFDRMNDIMQTTDDFHGFVRKRIGFTLRDAQLASFMEFSFAGIASILISEVVLGPKNNMNDLDMKLFLSSKEFNLNNTHISKSTATYR